VPDDDAGEVPQGVVVARGALTADAEVAHYKRVRYVEFIERERVARSPHAG
jgi:hypothetical protein